MKEKITKYFKKNKTIFGVVFLILINFSLSKISSFIDYKQEQMKNKVKYKNAAITIIKKNQLTKY